MQEEKIEEKVSAEECCGGGPKGLEECCGGGPKVEEEIFVHEVSGAGQPVIVNPVNPGEELDEE